MMEARRIVVLKDILLLALLCCPISVKLQDGIESSGAGEVTELITPDIFETSASGGGPDTTSDSDINVGILSEEQELNGTYIPIIPNNGNRNSMNETLGIDFSGTTIKSHETIVPSTTQETTTQSITTRDTTADEPVTTTTNSPLEVTTSEASTTEAQSTTTTPAATTRKTTRRTTTRPPTPKTLKPVISTTTSTIASDDELPSCSFIEEDFQCSAEITCFGDGEVDCTETDEEEPSVTTLAVSHPTEDEYDDDEYEESVTSSTGLLQVTGRIPQWKRLSSVRRHRFSSTTTTTEMAPDKETTSTIAKAIFETSTAFDTTQKAPITDSTVHPTETTASVLSTPTTNTEKPGTETANTRSPELHVELSTMASDDSSTGNGSSKVQESSTKQNPDSETSSEMTGTMSLVENTAKFIDPPLLDSAESVGMAESKNIRRRSKRQNRHPVPDSSVFSPSEALRLPSFSVGKERKDSRLCRIKGNLRCSPVPTMGFCKGSGRCQAPAEEKEKSTQGRGVENWAIAAIAICCAAAVITFGLLLYLAVTSWKKLKVQPQNGVTTLTYVNSATP